MFCGGVLRPSVWGYLHQENLTTGGGSGSELLKAISPDFSFPSNVNWVSMKVRSASSSLSLCT